MRTESSYPAPVYGVSTLAPRNRPYGYASEQINFRSDPVNKLTRRPSSVWRQRIKSLSGGSYGKVLFHSYSREGSEFSYIADIANNEVHCFIDDVYKSTVSLGSYNGENLSFYTVDHTTYILNKDVVVEKSPETDYDSIERVSYINVTSALNYGETVQINIIRDGVKSSVSYTIPNLGSKEPNYDRADKARATKQVAIELANRINNGTEVGDTGIPDPNFDPTMGPEYYYTYYDSADGEEYFTREENPDYDPSKAKPFLDNADDGIAGVSAIAKGSSVGIWDAEGSLWIHVEVESGQGDRSTVAINSEIEKTDGLPLYAKVGTRIKVEPDPTSAKGVYYLQAERTANEPSGDILEEVVWSEDRSYEEEFALKAETMPHKIEFDTDSDTFTASTINWDERKVGDDDSVPFPDFVGERITTMGYFQKRLCIAAGNSVYMTETDDEENWFRQSAVKLLVTDPIGVSTSAIGADEILHIVPHNRDLMCITSNAQFKIDGSQAVTPETVSMSMTTRYEVQVSVPPVTMGNSVYFPIDYGDSTGIQEYTGQRETSQDFASSITNHVIGLLKGEATLFAASPNLEMIALATSGAASNELFIYEQYTESGGKRSQEAWSVWRFSSDEEIKDIRFRKNELVLVTLQDGDIVTKAIPMYSRVTSTASEIYLDNLIEVHTDGTSVTLPDGYVMQEDTIIVRGNDADYPLWKVPYNEHDGYVTFKDIGPSTVYIGVPYTSSYTPTRPFKYDEDGSTITTDRIRVGKFILSLVDTFELSMLKTSDFADPITQDFESRFVGQYKIGTISTYTGDWKFSFSDDAALAQAAFFTDSYLGCTISDISWEGQYFQSKGRM